MKSIYRYAPGLLLILPLLMLQSCGGDDDVAPDRTLVEATSVLSRPASEIRTFLRVGGFQLNTDVLEYDVEIYSITYKTKYNDDEVVASALVSLPKNAPSADMLSFQHGTIAGHAQAPTAIHPSTTEMVLYSALAAPGFIAVVPDLIGFGTSKTKLHPYYVEELTASAVIDAMRAARDLASDKGIKFSGDVFLAGYSQGGYATMAAHKALEANPAEGLSLIASFPAAGGYDVKAMQEYFFDLDTYDQPFYIAFVAQAYRTTFAWTPPLSDFFNAPYAERIPALLNGSKTSSEINDQLTNSIPELIKADLLANINTDTKYKYLVDAFVANSLTDWKPTKPVFMYHGDADVTVPYNNSVITYNKLIANGASASVVTLTTLPGATHTTGIRPYIELFVPRLLDMRGE